MDLPDPTGRTRLAGRVVAATLLVGGTAWLDTGGAALAAPLLLADPASRGRNVAVLLGWIGAGAAVLGGIGYLVGGALTLPVSQLGTTGMGIALGGGLGGVVKLLAFTEASRSEPESMTVDMGGGADDTDSPEPRPADLFEASPSPLLYFDDSGDGPVVRAVNPAYEDTFGVSATAVEASALSDALMVTEQSDEIVAAAAEGEAFASTVACETPDGAASFRVQTAAVTDAAGARGYVIYTPLED